MSAASSTEDPSDVDVPIKEEDIPDSKLYASWLQHLKKRVIVIQNDMTRKVLKLCCASETIDDLYDKYREKATNLFMQDAEKRAMLFVACSYFLGYLDHLKKTGDRWNRCFSNPLFQVVLFFDKYCKKPITETEDVIVIPPFILSYILFFDDKEMQRISVVGQNRAFYDTLSIHCANHEHDFFDVDYALSGCEFANFVSFLMTRLKEMSGDGKQHNNHIILAVLECVPDFAASFITNYLKNESEFNNVVLKELPIEENAAASSSEDPQKQMMHFGFKSFVQAGFFVTSLGTFDHILANRQNEEIDKIFERNESEVIKRAKKISVKAKENEAYPQEIKDALCVTSGLLIEEKSHEQMMLFTQCLFEIEHWLVKNADRNDGVKKYIKEFHANALVVHKTIKFQNIAARLAQTFQYHNEVIAENRPPEKKETYAHSISVIHNAIHAQGEANVLAVFVRLVEMKLVCEAFSLLFFVACNEIHADRLFFFLNGMRYSQKYRSIQNRERKAAEVPKDE